MDNLNTMLGTDREMRTGYLKGMTVLRCHPELAEEILLLLLVLQECGMEETYQVT